MIYHVLGLCSADLADISSSFFCANHVVKEGYHSFLDVDWERKIDTENQLIK